MSSFSNVVLMGRLTADPELRYLPGNGTAVSEFTLAVNRKFTREGGEKVEEVAFVNVTCWKRLAEVAAEFLTKGRGVAVVGYLKQDRWEDKESGQKRSKLYVVASELQFLPKGAKDESDGDTPPTSPGGKERPRSRQTAGTGGSRNRQ